MLRASFIFPTQPLVCFKTPPFVVSFEVEGVTIMNQTEIGAFIAGCRKEKGLTQSQMAEQLGITDRAVSKWETGKSMPDASLMLELCEILGITVNELLSGERLGTESFEKKADENLIALKRSDENHRARNVVLSMLFSAALFTGGMVCLICDLAASGRLTWSLIPVISIVFAWAVIFPSILLGKRGIMASLLSGSVFLLPYLFLLSRLIQVKEVFSVGGAVAVPSVAFLWAAAVVFRRVGRERIWAASGLLCLLGIPLTLIINIVLSKLTEEPAFDMGDLVAVSVLFLLAWMFLLVDYIKRRFGKGDFTPKMKSPR